MTHACTVQQTLLPSGLNLALSSIIYIYNVASNFGKLIKFLQYLTVLLQLIVGNTSGCKDLSCCLSHAVQQCVDLAGILLFVEGYHTSELFEATLPP